MTMASNPPPRATAWPSAVRISAAMPGNGREAEPGLSVVSPGSGGDEDGTGLGLPPGIHDRTALPADMLVVPHPGFRVDRLAHRPQESQARQIPLRRPRVSPLHERADSGRRSVENGDAVSLDDLPHAVAHGPVRRALVHDGGRAVGERPIDQVAVTGHPTDVGRAPVDVILLEVEDPLRGRVGADQVPTGRVDDPLRLPGRPGGIEDVEHVLRVHRFRLAGQRRLRHQRVIPVIAVWLHRHWQRIVRLPADDNDVLDRRRLAHRIVHHLLERHDPAAPVATIGGHQHAGFRVVDPVAQRLGAEAAEHNAVHGADPRAGQHGNRQLRHERHVEHHPVAAPHAERLQDARERVDLAVEIEVRQRPTIARFPFPDERRLVAPGGAHVAVDAVNAGVDLAANKPFSVRRCPLEHRRPRLDPVELAGEALPESLGVFRGSVVDVGIGCVRGVTEGVGWRERAALLEQRVDFLPGRIGSLGHGSSCDSSG